MSKLPIILFIINHFCLFHKFFSENNQKNDLSYRFESSHDNKEEPLQETLDKCTSHDYH